jgi:hypothetical protein
MLDQPGKPYTGPLWLNLIQSNSMVGSRQPNKPYIIVCSSWMTLAIPASASN